MNDEAVASPCIDVCTLADNICEGCGRTIDEIVAWRDLSAAGKRAVLVAAKERRKAGVAGSTAAIESLRSR